MNKFKVLGTFLRDKRKEIGLTQSEVAEKLGYTSPQFISNFERGLSSPPLQSLRKIITIYKLDSEEVIQLLVDEHEKYLRKNLIGGRKKRSRSAAG